MTYDLLGYELWLMTYLLGYDLLGYDLLGYDLWLMVMTYNLLAYDLWLISLWLMSYQAVAYELLGLSCKLYHLCYTMLQHVADWHYSHMESHNISAILTTCQL